MEKVDARTSIATYKSFAALTKRTQEVFALGRTVAHEIGMDIPKFNAVLLILT